MPLSHKERSAINRQNASKSTGPRTPEGKAASSKNSTKHGMCAEVLLLEDENPAEYAAFCDEWISACAPADPAEAKVVDQMVYATIKMNRYARAEQGVISEQVRRAEAEWDNAEQAKFEDAKSFFQDDPRLCVIELKNCGEGVSWLLNQWLELKEAFDRYNCLNNLDAIFDALRLSGYHPEKLKSEDLDAYRFAVQLVSCIPNLPETSTMMRYLEHFQTSRWLACYGQKKKFDRDEAVAAVRARIEAVIADLTKLVDEFVEIDVASRDEAKLRAYAPADTAPNRLLLRYQRATENGFDKAVKTLAKLQAERQKMLEKEAVEASRQGSKTGLRNEPNGVSPLDLNKNLDGRCVNLNGTRYYINDVGDGNIILSPADPAFHRALIEGKKPDQATA